MFNSGLSIKAIIILSVIVLVILVTGIPTKGNPIFGIEQTLNNELNIINIILIVEIVNKQGLYKVDFNNRIINDNKNYIIVNTENNYSGDYIRNDNESNLLINGNYKFVNDYRKDIKMNRHVTELYDLNSGDIERINLHDENNKYIQIEKIIGYKKN